MCRCCAAGMTADGKPVFDCSDLSVHHIEPLSERFDLRLDDDNLITLCPYHHEQAERDNIDRNILHKIAMTPPGTMGAVFMNASTPTAGKDK